MAAMVQLLSNQRGSALDDIKSRAMLFVAMDSVAYQHGHAMDSVAYQHGHALKVEALALATKFFV